MKKLQKTKPVLALGLCLGICIASGLLISAARVYAAQTKHIVMTPAGNLHGIENGFKDSVPPPTGGNDLCIHLTAADQGRTVLTTPGEKVIVDLQENRFAGYRWSVSNTDEQVVSLENATLQTLQPEGLLVSPFTEHTARIYTFLTHEPGSTQLQFQYSHYDWRTETPKVSQQFTVTIQVGEAMLPAWPRLLSSTHLVPVMPARPLVV